MDHKSLKDRTIEDVMSQVRNSSNADSARRGALTVRCTIEIAGSLANVWAGLHDVKAALVNASTEASNQSTELAKLTAALANNPQIDTTNRSATLSKRKIEPTPPVRR
jgi:hypothetical protein